MSSFTTARLYKSFSFINSSVQIFQPFSEAATRNAIKKLLSNILWYSQENTCDGASLLIKLKAIRPVVLLQRDSNTDIFV